MAYLLAGTVVILVFLGAGASRRLSPFSPLLLGGFAWLAVFVCGLLWSGSFHPVTESAFFLWLIWFVVSGLCYLFLSGRPQIAGGVPARRLPVDYAPLVAVLIIWLAWQMRRVGAAGPAAFFSNLRLSTTPDSGLESLGLVSRFYPLAFALFLFEHVHARPGNRRLRWLLWALLGLYALSTMGKLTALMPLLGWAVVQDLRGRLPRRRLLLLVPAAFGLLFALHVLRALVGEQIVLSRFLGVYVYSPLVALGYMGQAPDLPFGAHVFRLGYAVWHAVLGGPEPVAVVQPYVAVPYATNVYTVIQPFALDFGVAGVAFGALFYGLFFSLAWQLARSRRTLPMMIYAGLSMAVFGQFIGDFLFTMGSGQLQFAAWAAVVVALSREVVPPEALPAGNEEKG